MAEGGSDRLAGFLAAADGLPRDESQSVWWLHGFDGYFAGVAENARVKAELDAVAAAMPKRRVDRRAHVSLTPRALDGSWRS